MATLKQAADEFLAQKRIAVAGVSRTDSGHGANVVYKGLRKAGYCEDEIQALKDAKAAG